MASYLSRHIELVTDNHELDFVVDRCKVNDICELKSGHEVTFVSLTADYLLKYLRENIDEQMSFQDWVYMPSRRAERKVGYDLSIGRYDGIKRIRSMHKLLLSWCDSRRSWTLSPSREGDYQHLVSLYNDWSENNILPFLVIHICFCIHDYRRMGKVFEIGGNQVAFPGFENLLRTIVVPLNELFIFFREINFAPERNQFKVRYFRCSTAKARNESAQDFWNRISLPENHCAMVQIDGNYERELQIINLPDWRNMVVSHFLNRKNA